MPPPRAVHTNVTCDGCTKPIEGTRHKCLTCDDFDFCEVCIADLSKRKTHNAAHPFFAIPTPQDGAAYNTARSEVQPKPVPKPVHHNEAQCDVCSEYPIRGVRYCCLDCHRVSYDLCTKCMGNPEVRMKHDLKHVFFPMPTPGYITWYKSAVERRKESGLHKAARIMKAVETTVKLVNTVVNGPS